MAGDGQWYTAAPTVSQQDRARLNQALHRLENARNDHEIKRALQDANSLFKQGMVPTRRFDTLYNRYRSRFEKTQQPNGKLFQLLSIADFASTAVTRQRARTVQKMIDPEKVAACWRKILRYKYKDGRVAMATIRSGMTVEDGWPLCLQIENHYRNDVVCEWAEYLLKNFKGIDQDDVREKTLALVNDDPDVALYHAVNTGSFGLAELLLENGADVNSDNMISKIIEDVYDQNPADLLKIQWMLDHGAEISFEDNSSFSDFCENIMGYIGDTVKPHLFNLLVKGGHVDVNIYYGANGISTSMLHYAAFEGRPYYIDQLIRLGAGVNTVDENGKEAISESIEMTRYDRRDDTRAVELLLRAGANPYINNLFTEATAPYDHDRNNKILKRMVRAFLDNGYVPLPEEIHPGLPPEIRALIESRIREIQDSPLEAVDIFYGLIPQQQQSQQQWRQQQQSQGQQQQQPMDVQRLKRPRQQEEEEKRTVKRLKIRHSKAQVKRWCDQKKRENKLREVRRIAEEYYSSKKT